MATNISELEALLVGKKVLRIDAAKAELAKHAGLLTRL